MSTPPPYCHAPLEFTNTRTQLATNNENTIMSSVTSPQRPDNDGARPHLVISVHDAGILRLVYLPDGRRVVIGFLDGTMKVWSVENREQEGTSMKHATGILLDLAVTRDGTRIISSGHDGKVKVWDVETHKLVKEWTHPGDWPRIAISPDDRLVAVGDQAVAIYTVEGRQVNHSIKLGGYRVLSLCFSPDGNKLACGTYYGIRVYDVDTATLILGPLKGHLDLVEDVLWSRDGSRLFSGSTDKTIRCWNSDTGEQIGLPWTGHTEAIVSLSLSPNGSVLASASWDKTVRFWDATTGNPIGHLQHDDEVRIVRFSPSGESMVSASRWGAKIYLWGVPRLNSVENQARTLIRYSIYTYRTLHPTDRPC